MAMNEPGEIAVTSSCHCPASLEDARAKRIGRPLLIRSSCVPCFDDAAFFDGDDPVAVPDGGKTVRDDEHRAAMHNPLHVVLNDALAFIIERAGGFIENQDARIHDQRARNGDALALAAGKVGAALADTSVS